MIHTEATILEQLSVLLPEFRRNIREEREQRMEQSLKEYEERVVMVENPTKFSKIKYYYSEQIKVKSNEKKIKAIQAGYAA